MNHTKCDSEINNINTTYDNDSNNVNKHIIYDNRTSLIMLYKKGHPVSYIKGISHFNNNMCKASMHVLKKCNMILYETHTRKADGKGNSENIIYDYMDSMDIEKIYLDKTTKHIRKNLPDLIDEFDLNEREYRRRRERNKKLGIETKRNVNTKSWITDRQLMIDRTRINKKYSNNDSYQKFKQYAIIDRNNAWFDTIEKSLKTNKCFIVCGNDHVDDIIHRLENKGYRLTFIPQMRYRFSYKKFRKYIKHTFEHNRNKN